MADGPGVVDVLIAGAGPAGAATALALAREGWSVRIVESSTAGAVRVGETVPPAIRVPLGELGLWECFLGQEHLPSAGNASAWGSPDLERRDFAFHPYGTGWHLDRGRFDAMLTAAAEDAGAVLLRPSRIMDTAWDGTLWRVTVRMAGGLRSLAARSLVDATGRSAALIRKLGGRRRSLDRLVAFVGWFQPSPKSEPPDAEVLLEAVENGWWYSAPLPDGRLVAGFFTDADLGGAIRSGGWSQQLARTGPTRERLAGWSASAPLVVHSAASVWSDLPEVPGFLAVGDAALAYDPLSSQGIVKGMTSGLRAAAALLADRRGRQDALAEERARVRKELGEYLEKRSAYYAFESRWPTSPFWTRRNPHLDPGLRRLLENHAIPAASHHP